MTAVHPGPGRSVTRNTPGAHSTGNTLDAVILAFHFCYTSVTNVGQQARLVRRGFSFSLRNDFSFASIFPLSVTMLTGRAEVKKKTTDEIKQIAAS
jgi:hypothetical protein